MIAGILHKHATLGINNGVVIEGFVQDKDEHYFKVVERNNNIVIIRIDDISFAKIQEQIEAEELDISKVTPVFSKQTTEDFSMSLPAQTECAYNKPTFLRVTPK